MSKKRNLYHHTLMRFKTELGEAFRRLREERGLRPEDIQEKLGLKSTCIINQVEKGNCKRLFIYYRLCCFYGVKPAVSFIVLPEEENLFLQIEKERLLREQEQCAEQSL